MRYRLTNEMTVAQRQAKKAESDAKFAESLKKSTKAWDAQRQEQKQKKKSSDELLKKLNVSDIACKAIRPAYEYVPKSYNIYKQTYGLINHMFVKYPTPYFLYETCLAGYDKRPGYKFPFMSDIYRQWFVTLAQGGSFRKLVQGTMTAKEASVFLSGPFEEVHENVWYAKMKVAGMSESMIYKLMDRIFSNYFFDDKHGRMAELIAFYVKHGEEFDKEDFQAVTDFAIYKLRNDQEFRFKGRTKDSMIALSNEWHILMQKAKLGKHCEWPGFGIDDWTFETDKHVWLVTEIRTNKDLMNEARKMKHCVYSYVQSCIDGRCSIFSMRGYYKSTPQYDPDGNVIGWDMPAHAEFTRVTIEVNRQRNVVQVKGASNRPIEGFEKEVLRNWQGTKGITGRG